MTENNNNVNNDTNKICEISDPNVNATAPDKKLEVSDAFVKAMMKAARKKLKRSTPGAFGGTAKINRKSKNQVDSEFTELKDKLVVDSLQ